MHFISVQVSGKLQIISICIYMCFMCVYMYMLLQVNTHMHVKAREYPQYFSAGTAHHFFSLIGNRISH